MDIDGHWDLSSKIGVLCTNLTISNVSTANNQNHCEHFFENDFSLSRDKSDQYQEYKALKITCTSHVSFFAACAEDG